MGNGDSSDDTFFRMSCTFCQCFEHLVNKFPWAGYPKLDPFDIAVNVGSKMILDAL